MILVLVEVLKNIKSAVANQEHQLSVYKLKADNGLWLFILTSYGKKT